MPFPAIGIFYPFRFIVMPGLVPGIHVFFSAISKDVDGRA
jgi:hypothetical protein